MKQCKKLLLTTYNWHI